MFDKLASLKAKGKQLLVHFPFKPTTINAIIIRNIVFLYTYHLKKYYTNKFKGKNV